MTCAIRENAETKVFGKLQALSRLKANGRIKQIGLLGCIAERAKTKILDKHRSIDVIVGPDGYRDLPKLLAINRLSGEKAVNVLLSLDETYSDVMPTMTSNAVTGFVSIMRGCDNVCHFESDFSVVSHLLFSYKDVFLLCRSVHQRKRKVTTFRLNRG